MATCPRCGRENESDVRFCGRCGLDLPRYTPTATTDDGPLGHCYRHPRVPTNLSCGRCERPVCTKCAINGPAGIRCPECAKHNIALRPAGIVHGAKRSLFSFRRVGPYGLYLLLALISIVAGTMRSCGARDRDDASESEIETPARAPREDSSPNGSSRS